MGLSQTSPIPRSPDGDKKMFPQYLSNVKEALLAESRCLDTIVVLMLMQFNSYDYPGIDGTLYVEVPG